MDDSVLGTVEQHRHDPVAGTDARRDQEVGEAVGQPVVLAVVEPPFAGDQRRLFRPAPGGAPQDLA